MADLVMSPHCLRHTDKSADYGEDGEDHERAKHHPGALMNAVSTRRLGLKHKLRVRSGVDGCPLLGEFVRLSAALTEESEIPQPEHVKRGKARSDPSDEPEEFATMRPDERLVENFVLAEETGEGRKSTDSEDRHGHRPECNGDFLAQAAHNAHILLAAEAMNDGASREEQK